MALLNGHELYKHSLQINANKQYYDAKIPVRIFTATPMNARTENYYSTKISVVEAPLATNEGRIIQYRGVSGAKGINDDKLPVLTGYIKSKLSQETINNSCLLTFRSKIALLEDIDYLLYTAQSYVSQNSG